MTQAQQFLNPLFGGGGQFSPRDIAGLKLWLDADDLPTLFQDSGKTVPVLNDGNPIGAWADKSGNGNDAIQATISKKSTYKTGIINARSIARFDGVDDLMTYPTINALPGTVFVVMVETAISGSHAMIGNSGVAVGFEAIGVAPSRLVRLVNNVVIIVSSTINTSVPNISAFDINTTNINLYYNNINIGTTSHTLTSFNINSMGTRNSFEFFYGDIAEILVYTSVLSSTQRQNIHQYLIDKWGI